MQRKKHILVFIDWFLPAYKAGGQIPSVYNIIKLLSNEVDFSIVTSNSDEGDSPFKNLIFNKWTTNFGIRIIYISPENQNYSFLTHLIDNEIFDAAYFNSFFSFRFTTLPIYIVKNNRPCSKIILAPRGMLGKEALAIKPFKKQLFISLARFFNFYKNISWHASSELESNEIKAILGQHTQNIKTAIDISILPEMETVEKEKEINSLKVFYLSRITDKKNLLGAIEILQELHKGDIQFDIIGPIGNNEYWEKCQKAINNLPENIKTNYLGAIPNYELAEILRKYHVFLFPTLNENYGHVIAESLAAACPVILSERTPWQDLEENNAGWVIKIENKQGFVEKLESMLTLDKLSYNQLANNALNYIHKKITDSSIIQDNKAIFLS